MTLLDVNSGNSALIMDLVGDSIVMQRLHEMGVRRGLSVKRLGQAPLGGPILIQVHHGVIALRRKEAECVIVTAAESSPS